MDSVLECYSRLCDVLGPSIESVDVIKRAEEHRWYWRPSQVKIVLLAESHVYTTDDELAREIRLPPSAPSNLPRGFVRLVYCLGYGENSLLDRPISSPRNNGTPQFWKIFYSCINNATTNTDFIPIHVSATLTTERIANKLSLLHQLREQGVWLLDTCLAALYLPGSPKPSHSTRETCLQVGWDYHIGNVLQAANPQQVICIGKGVFHALEDRLGKIRIPVKVLPQPQARLSSAEHFQSFGTYYHFVQEVNKSM